jgi:predicted amidohydrolase YtcJ
MVVLARNLFEVPPSQISQVRVRRTFVEGEEVHTAP